MDAPRTPDATPLPIPRIPLALDGGLGYSDVARTPDAYVIVQVGPWDGFQNDDVVQIRWGANSTVIGTRYASAADRNKAIDVFVPGSAIQAVGEGRHDVVARIQHSDASAPVDSYPIHVLVKLSVPGGEDTDPLTLYTNDNLKAPTVNPSSIVPETKTVTVKVPAYANMAFGDLIVIRWNIAGNDIAYGPIEAAEAGKDVIVPIPESVFRGGGVGLRLKVSYQVYDIAHNWSLWSLRTNVEVRDKDAPVMPWVAGTVSDRQEALDLEVLKDADLTITVQPDNANTADTFTLHWAGTTAAGLPLAFDTQPMHLIPGEEKIIFVIPNAQVTPLSQGTARAWYTLAPANQGPERTSQQCNLTVDGKVARLIHPSLAEARDTTLDPADIPGSVAHALVPAWHGMQMGDSVDLIGDGTTSIGEPTQWTDSQSISGTMLHKDVPFDVPRDIVAALVGGHLRLYYLVTPYETITVQGAARRVALAALPSDTLQLDVRDASALPRLAAPVIRELEAGGYLDPDKGRQVHLEIPEYTDIAKNDRIDIAVRGGVEQHDDRNFVVNPTTPPRFLLPESLIQPNRGQALTASYTVSRAGGGTATSSPLPFRVGAPSQTGLPAPTFGQENDDTVDVLGTYRDGLYIAKTSSLTAYDEVTPILVGMDKSYAPRSPQWGNPEGMNFTLHQFQFSASVGRDVSIYYQVLNKNTGAFRLSPVTTFHVLDIPSNDSRIETPTIDEAGDGSILDMNTFGGDATVVRPHISRLTDEARFSIRARSGTTSSIVADHALVTGGPTEFLLARSWLVGLPDKSVITLEMEYVFRARDEETSEEGIMRTFQSKPYTLLCGDFDPGFLAPSLPEASGGELEGWLSSATLRIPANAALRSGDNVTAYFNESCLGTELAEGSDAIDFSITGKLIEDVQGRSVNAYYSVQRNGVTWTSTTLTVSVIAPPQTPIPSILEANGGELSGWLSSANLRMPANSGLRSGDVVTGYFNGTILGAKNATGSSAIDFSITSKLIADAQGRSIDAYYTVQRSGVTWTSTTLTVAVVAPPQTPPPSILEANGGELSGWLTSANLRMPANSGLRSGDVVTGYFNGTSLGAKNATGSSAIDFSITSKLIADAQGRSIDAYYTVQRSGVTWTSTTLTVAVVAPPQTPPPSILEASGDELGGWLSSANLRMPANSGLRSGDVVTGYFNGTSLGAKNATGSSAIDFSITSKLIADAQGRSVNAHYTVQRSGVTWASTTLTVSVVAPPQLPAPTLLEAVGDELGGWLARANLRMPSFPGLKIGDFLTGYFDNHIVGTATVTEPDSFDFEISKSLIEDAQERTVSCQYSVKRKDVVWTSPSLIVKVSKGNLYFPGPLIPQMRNGSLDGTLNSATISVAVGGDIRYGDGIRAHFGHIAFAVKMAAGNVLNFTIDRGMIQEARNRRIECGYWVTRDNEYTWDSAPLMVDVT